MLCCFKRLIDRNISLISLLNKSLKLISIILLQEFVRIRKDSIFDFILFE